MAQTRHCRPIADFSDGLPLALLLHLFLLIPGRVVAQSSPPSDNSNSLDNAKFHPSMAIVILVLICAFFFLGFFSIYIRQCVGEDASVLGGAPNRGFAAARSRHLQRGLKPEVIDTFPTLVYSEVKEHKIGKAALECAVCLSEFEDDETLRLLPHCSHVFHQDCIDAWLESHVTCPVCRANLSEAAPAADPIACDHRTTSPPSNVASPEILGPSHDRRSEEQAQPEHVVIVVDRSAEEEQRKAEAIELARIGSKRRDARSRSGRRPAKFPRSHSTGHLGVQRVENLDRYTLRLPEHIRKEIFTSRKFHRSTSCVAFPTEGSARRGYRGGNGEGSSRGGGRSIRLGKSERWPSFLIRTFSTKIPAWAAGRRGDNEGSVKKGETDGSTREKIATVATPFDCLGVGAAAAGGGKAKAEVVANADESHTAALTRRV